MEHRARRTGRAPWAARATVVTAAWLAAACGGDDGSSAASGTGGASASGGAGSGATAGSGGATTSTGGGGGTGATAGSGGATSAGGSTSTGGASGAATGGSTSTGGSASTASETEACVRYIEAACQRLVVCGVAGDPDLCVEGVARMCPDYLFGPGAVRTADELLACADDVLHWPCGDQLPPCVVSGTHAPGEACVAPSQCASRACDMTAGACGTCREVYAAGEVCEPQGSKVCPVDTTCSSAGACEPAPPGTSPPASGWVLCLCDDPACTLTPPFCRTKRHVGEACDDASRVCHASADCVDGVCVAKGTPDYFAQTCGAP